MAKDKNKKGIVISGSFVWSFAIAGVLYALTVLFINADVETTRRILDIIGKIGAHLLLFALIWFAVFIIARMIKDIREDMKR